MSRLPSHLVVGALVRRVHDAGGSAMVLARGDTDGGTILVVAVERGADPRFLERGITPSGAVGIVRHVPDDADANAIDAYWRRRRERDPDLWVIEVDVAAPERFVEETILGD